MSCCSEPNCRRTTPILVRRAPFSGQWMAITRYKRHDSGLVEAHEKHVIPADSQVVIELESTVARDAFEFVKAAYADAVDGSEAEAAYRAVLDKFAELAEAEETELKGPRPSEVAS